MPKIDVRQELAKVAESMAQNSNKAMELLFNALEELVRNPQDYTVEDQQELSQFTYNPELNILPYLKSMLALIHTRLTEAQVPGSQTKLFSPQASARIIQITQFIQNLVDMDPNDFAEFNSLLRDVSLGHLHLPLHKRNSALQDALPIFLRTYEEKNAGADFFNTYATLATLTFTYGLSNTDLTYYVKKLHEINQSERSLYDYVKDLQPDLLTHLEKYITAQLNNASGTRDTLKILVEVGAIPLYAEIIKHDPDLHYLYRRLMQTNITKYAAHIPFKSASFDTARKDLSLAIASPAIQAVTNTQALLDTEMAATLLKDAIKNNTDREWQIYFLRNLLTPANAKNPNFQISLVDDNNKQHHLSLIELAIMINDPWSIDFIVRHNPATHFTKAPAVFYHKHAAFFDAHTILADIQKQITRAQDFARATGITDPVSNEDIRVFYTTLYTKLSELMVSYTEKSPSLGMPEFHVLLNLLSSWNLEENFDLQNLVVFRQQLQQLEDALTQSEYHFLRDTANNKISISHGHDLVSYDELKERKDLGKGSYGGVYRFKYSGNNRDFLAATKSIAFNGTNTHWVVAKMPTARFQEFTKELRIINGMRTDWRAKFGNRSCPFNLSSEAYLESSPIILSQLEYYDIDPRTGEPISGTAEGLFEKGFSTDFTLDSNPFSSDFTLENVSICHGQVTRSMFGMHSIGYIHLDIAPRNVLVSGKGQENLTFEYKLADFGYTEKLHSYGFIDSLRREGPIRSMSKARFQGKPLCVVEDFFANRILLLEQLARSLDIPIDMVRNVNDDPYTPCRPQDVFYFMMGENNNDRTVLAKYVENLRILIKDEISFFADNQKLTALRDQALAYLDTFQPYLTQIPQVSAETYDTVEKLQKDLTLTSVQRKEMQEGVRKEIARITAEETQIQNQANDTYFSKEILSLCDQPQHPNFYNKLKVMLALPVSEKMRQTPFYAECKELAANQERLQHGPQPNDDMHTRTFAGYLSSIKNHAISKRTETLEERISHIKREVDSGLLTIQQLQDASLDLSSLAETEERLPSLTDDTHVQARERITQQLQSLQGQVQQLQAQYQREKDESLAAEINSFLETHDILIQSLTSRSNILSFARAVAINDVISKNFQQLHDGMIKARFSNNFEEQLQKASTRLKNLAARNPNFKKLLETQKKETNAHSLQGRLERPEVVFARAIAPALETELNIKTMFAPSSVRTIAWNNRNYTQEITAEIARYDSLHQNVAMLYGFYHQAVKNIEVKKGKLEFIIATALVSGADFSFAENMPLSEQLKQIRSLIKKWPKLNEQFKNKRSELHNKKELFIGGKQFLDRFQLLAHENEVTEDDMHAAMNAIGGHLNAFLAQHSQNPEAVRQLLATFAQLKTADGFFEMHKTLYQSEQTHLFHPIANIIKPLITYHADEKTQSAQIVQQLLADVKKRMGVKVKAHDTQEIRIIYALCELSHNHRDNKFKSLNEQIRFLDLELQLSDIPVKRRIGLFTAKPSLYDLQKALIIEFQNVYAETLKQADAKQTRLILHNPIFMSVELQQKTLNTVISKAMNDTEFALRLLEEFEKVPEKELTIPMLHIQIQCICSLNKNKKAIPIHYLEGIDKCISHTPAQLNDFNKFHPNDVATFDAINQSIKDSNAPKPNLMTQAEFLQLLLDRFPKPSQQIESKVKPQTANVSQSREPERTAPTPSLNSRRR